MLRHHARYHNVVNKHSPHFKTRILAKSCYWSKIVGGSGFLVKNRILPYYRGPCITEAHITEVGLYIEILTEHLICMLSTLLRPRPVITNILQTSSSTDSGFGAKATCAVTSARVSFTYLETVRCS